MDYMEFKCQGDNLEHIPEEVMAKTGVAFPEAHTNSRDMSVLAKALKEHKNDTICKLPFCVTVLAEASGAHIKLGDNKFGPRVDQYAFSSLAEMKELRDIDFDKGRIAEVLKSVETLSNAGEIVALNIDGPFTLISSLIEPMVFYKEIRKDKEAVESLLQKIENNIFSYMVEGIKRGARIISYGDPVGSIDIVGPKVYKEISGKTTFNVLKRLEKYLMETNSNVLVHICGKTSTAFSKLEFCKTEPIQFEEGISYGQAIESMLNNGCGVRCVGHNCIKRTPLKLKNAVVWGITLE